MDEELIPLGISFDLPICLHIPDQDYLVVSSGAHRGYYSLTFLKVDEDKFFDRLGHVTRQFRYSRVMVGFPGSMTRLIGPYRDPATGEEMWQTIIAPSFEPDLHKFNEKCILPLEAKYGFEKAVSITGIRPVNRFLSLYRRQTHNFFACGISEVDPFLDLDRMSIFYFVPTPPESKHQQIKIRTIISPYVGSRIPDIPKEWNDQIYSKLQHEEEAPSDEEVLQAANYCFFKGLCRCAVVELETVFELLIKKELVFFLENRGDNEKEIDDFFKKNRKTRKIVSAYDTHFPGKGFHKRGHLSYELWNNAYSIYRNAVSHDGHLISATDTERFFSDYNRVFQHLFGKTVWLDPLKHTIPPSEKTIRVSSE